MLLFHQWGTTDGSGHSKNQLTMENHSRLGFQVWLLRPKEAPQNILETVPFSLIGYRVHQPFARHWPIVGSTT